MDVLLTGGDTDLGRAIAGGFRDAGPRHRHRRVAARRPRGGRRGAPTSTRSSSTAPTRPVLEAARAQFPHHLDAIVNVPALRGDGADPRTYTLAQRAAAWRTALDATVLSAVLTVQILGDHLRSGGSIVNVVADAAVEGSPGGRHQGRAVELDGRTSHALRDPGHHAERGGVRPRCRAGLRRHRAGRRRRSPRRSPGWRCSSPRPPPGTSPGRRCTSATARCPPSPEPEIFRVRGQ